MTEILTNSTRELAQLILRGMATDADLKNEKPENIRAIKEDRSEPHYRALSSTAAKGSRERSLRFVASDETRDRAGDIIRVKGWDFTEFRKNPVALWSHDGYSLPIGRVFDWQKGKRVNDESPVLLESIEYATAEMNPHAEFVYRLADGDFLRAVSVGFLPIKTVWPETPEERQAMGLGPYGAMFEKVEQMELSQCSIGCNPNALSEAAKSLAKSFPKGSEILDALGIPARSTTITVGDIPTTKSESVAEAPAQAVERAIAQLKSELLAELAKQTEQLETLTKSVHKLRRKLAKQAGDSSNAPGCPPAASERHDEGKSEADTKSARENAAFLARLKQAFDRGEVAGGKNLSTKN